MSPCRRRFSGAWASPSGVSWTTPVRPLALHLLQPALDVNTLLMQQVLADPKWADTLTDADRRARSPLFWTHVNPYGRFEPDMNRRLDLDLTACAAAVPVPRTPQGEPVPAPGR